VVHCVTPSGTMNDLDAIAPVVAAHGALLLVDAVSSFGGARCDFAGWRAGIAVVAPQKCLGGPPGLSLLHVSDDAWRHLEANPRAPGGPRWPCPTAWTRQKSGPWPGRSRGSCWPAARANWPAGCCRSGTWGRRRREGGPR
jgi:pyridoxamine---pyruvate transaminase